MPDRRLLEIGVFLRAHLRMVSQAFTKRLYAGFSACRTPINPVLAAPSQHIACDIAEQLPVTCDPVVISKGRDPGRRAI